MKQYAVSIKRVVVINLITSPPGYHYCHLVKIRGLLAKYATIVVPLQMQDSEDSAQLV
jgi:hypothetical protein